MAFTKTVKATKFYSGQRVDVADMQTNLLQYLIDTTRQLEVKCGSDGVISGLSVTDNSLLISQLNVTADISTLKGNLNNKLCQIFQATSSQIQKIFIKAKQNGSASNMLTMSICPLADPADPTSAISYLSAIAQAPFAESSITTGYTDIEFDFTSTPLAAYGALTVGNYYAIVLNSGSTLGIIDFRYNDNLLYNYAYGFIREVTTGITTDHDTWDLYFKIYSDNVTLATGYAYKDGQPIVVAAVIPVVELLDTVGADNFLCIRYTGILSDLEVNPTWGNMEYSRTEDGYEIQIFNQDFTTIDSSWLILYRLRHNDGESLLIDDMRPFMPHADVLRQVYIQGELATGTNQTRVILNIPYKSDYSAAIDIGSIADIKVYVEDDEYTTKGIGTGTPAAGAVNINPATMLLTFHPDNVVTNTFIYVDYYASLSLYRNKLTVQDLEILGNAVFNGNIKLLGNISIDQTTIDSSSDTEDDTYTGAETNLKEDLDRIKHEIKNIKGLTGTNVWRTAASSSLSQSDYDNVIGEGLFNRTYLGLYNQMAVLPQTGFNFDIDSGKSIINKVITKFPVSSKSIVAPTTGAGNELIYFADPTSYSFVGSANYGILTLDCDGTPKRLIGLSHASGHRIKYGLSGCTFSIDGSYTVIAVPNHHFLVGDYISIAHTNTYDTTVPIAIAAITTNSISVLSSYSHGGSTFGTDIDGYVFIDTGGATPTKIFVDYYGTSVVGRVSSDVGTSGNNFTYTYALPRYDIVYISNDTTITVLRGTPASSPTIPTVPTINDQLLYQIYVEGLLDSYSANHYNAYDSGFHNGRLPSLNNAFIDKRTFLNKDWEYSNFSNIDVLLSGQVHYDLRIKRLFRYKTDARIRNIDYIDPANGDVNSEFLYSDDIGGAGTEKVSTFIYSHAEGKVYVKGLSYHPTYFYITTESHLTLLATRARSYILTSFNGTEYLINVNASNIISTSVSGVSPSIITDFDKDIDLQIFSNGALCKDSSTSVIHKISGNDAGTIFATSINSDYVSDGYLTNNLNSLNYIRITNPEYGIIFRGESFGNRYRIQVSDTGVLTTTLL